MSSTTNPSSTTSGTSGTTNKGGVLSSTLSTDSPPFNPRGLTGIGRSSPGPNASAGGTVVPPPSVARNSTSTTSSSSAVHSRNSSPTSTTSSNAAGGGGGTTSNNSTPGGTAGDLTSNNTSAILSNAIPKHTFVNPTTNEPLEIRNVWADNVEQEMAQVRRVVETHPYVAMDTEFPGVVVRPVSETYSPDYHYKTLKCNVDLLKIIQLGLSFADKDGNLAPGCPCWQFNFQWTLSEDIFAQDSIDLLVHSGISFEDHAQRGIDPLLFGELLMVSGLVLDDRVRWVSYHSGYDYAYLLKILTTRELPSDEKSFFDLLKVYFPTIYDMKYMTSLCDGHFGGLQRLADDLNCPRIGSEHQAGSDSLLTMTTYFALCKAKFLRVNNNSGSSGSNGSGNSGAGGGRGGVVTPPPGSGGATTASATASPSSTPTTAPTTPTLSDQIDDSRYKNELYGYGNNHTVYKGGGRYGSQQSGNTSAIPASILSAGVSGVGNGSTVDGSLSAGGGAE